MTANDEYFPNETGRVVYERTYARPKPDGSKEIWPETVKRVVDGNLALADTKHLLPNERERLIDLMLNFKILPAGRHLWASGVPGRQYLFNCHVSGWGEKLSDHFEFSFMRLMEGGGVGANYSFSHLWKYGAWLHGPHNVHIVCDEAHQDYQKLKEAGVLSAEYTPEWAGAFEVEDSREGWAGALVDLLDTYGRTAQNENRVFDVSRVRPEGARLKTFGGRASGPLPLAVMLQEVAEILNNRARSALYMTGLDAMEIDHAIAKCVVSGGNRRSARMAIMHWRDEEIFQFIGSKKDGLKHWTTNISVEVDEDFFRGVEQNDPRATAVLNDIAIGMLTNGEPGFWNSELSNVDEPNPVIATNPCGEIPLTEWENCNLGHVNLGAFVRVWPEIRSDDSPVMRPQTADLDTVGLHEAHELMTRFLIRATYGDVTDGKQAAVLAKNRRIGVGHFGFASMLAKLGIKYSEAPSERSIKHLLWDLADIVDKAAIRYSHDLRIPVPVKKRTVAPTGTIAKLPGTSEGIHPIFAKYFIRRIRFSTIDPAQRDLCMEYFWDGYKVEDCQYAPNTLVVEIPTKDSLVAEVEAIWGGDAAELIVQTPAELSLVEMLAVQELYQTCWADNAVSYTANIDTEKYTVEEVSRSIISFGRSLKGATVFPETSMPQAPYERISREDFEQYGNKTSVADSLDEDCASGACPIR